MLKEVNQACKRLNQCLGLSIPLPEPGPNALKKASIRNFAVGAGLTAAGALLSSRSLFLLGCAGITGGVLLRQEADRQNGQRS